MKVALIAIILLLNRIGFVSSTLNKAQAPTLGSTKKSARGNVDLVFVPAGEFTMGSESRKDEKPVRKVTLDGYWIGKNDVTVAQFRAYCNETSYKYNWDSNKPEWGWLDDHPMIEVTWDEARAFCKWEGGDLPTEAQWEKAARGTDGREYPWGNEWDPKKCWCSRNEFGDAGGTAPVGSFTKGASPYGCLDMAGNVWQWCLDWHDESGYDKDEIKDPTGPAFGRQRVLRGGSWYSNLQNNFRSANRFYGDPTGHCSFRLAGPPSL